MIANYDPGPLLTGFLQLIMAIILIGAALSDVLLLARETVRGIKRVRKIISDFRSGIWYKPFFREEPVIVRQTENFQELSDNTKLSQRAVYSDIFGFHYNLANTEINLDPNEIANVRYRLFARAIRKNGLSQIDMLLPHLQANLDKVMMEKIDPYTDINVWSSFKIAPLMQDFATGMLGTYFFGPRLSSEKEFSSAMSRFYSDTLTFSKMLQVIPKYMQPLIHKIVTNRGHALKVLFARLHQAANREEDCWKEDETTRKLTLYNNLLEASVDSNYWNETLLIQASVGLWFAASHQPWINLQFIFLELCARPDYAEILRREISNTVTLDYETITSLPLLDSFIKEAVRLNVADKMAVRRKALAPFTFSHGGPQIATGQVVCLSAWDLMHDETKYPNPDEFDGFRFVRERTGADDNSSESGVRGTTFTEASKDYPIWGLGSKACPGRWHSSLVLKMTVIHLLKNYEFRLEDKPESYRWFWESFQMPYESSRVSFRRLQSNDRSAENPAIK